MPDVAIVMPVYNQERCLRAALDSLFEQTDRSFVVICVDDGSTDESTSILREYMTRGRVSMHVLRQENSGVSAARNLGLRAALGTAGIDSVMFLDPDDTYDPQCVERARAAARVNHGCVCEFDFILTGGRIVTGRRSPSVCNKIYPLAMVKGVEFFEGSNVAEDLVFNLEIAHRRHPRFVHMPQALYRYSSVSTSTTHRPLSGEDFTRRIAIVERLIDIYADDPDARDIACREEVPEILKQFWRDLGRVMPADRVATRRMFSCELRSLRCRGLLHPKRGRMKDIKYYLRFLWLSRGGGRCC